MGRGLRSTIRKADKFSRNHEEREFGWAGSAFRPAVGGLVGTHHPPERARPRWPGFREKHRIPPDPNHTLETQVSPVPRRSIVDISLPTPDPHTTLGVPGYVASEMNLPERCD
jgi:hypothetical protein